MDMLYKILLWGHLLGIALGGAASFGHPVLGAIADSTPEARPHMMRAAKALGTIGRAGIGFLVVSGALMLWLAHDLSTLSGVFWAKMGLVVLLVGNVILASRAARALAGGDETAAARLPIHAMIGLALMLLLLAFGVLAFR